MDTKTRQTNYGGPIQWPDGYGKETNPPDDKYIDEVVNPAGGRPSFAEVLGLTSATEQEIEAEKADQAYMERSRQFRITEAAATGARNALFDEEEN
jgi:hypothetical protein